jgi:hypothetical protein
MFLFFFSPTDQNTCGHKVASDGTTCASNRQNKISKIPSKEVGESHVSKSNLFRPNSYLHKDMVALNSLRLHKINPIRTPYLLLTVQPSHNEITNALFPFTLKGPGPSLVCGQNFVSQHHPNMGKVKERNKHQSQHIYQKTLCNSHAYMAML